MNKFGGRFRQCRIEAGMNQSTAAKLAGISQQSISAYENGSRIPLADAIIAMARVYGVSVDYLLGVSDSRDGLIVDFLAESED